MECLICGDEVTEVITDTLRDGQKSNVYYCRECDLGFLDNNKNQEELMNYYRDTYRTDSPEKIFGDFFAFQKDRIDIIVPHINKNTKLLEVGCSAGMFLSHVKDLCGEIAGLDYDIRSSKFTEETCKCRVYANDSDLPEQYFDIVCMFQTLEHVHDPKEFLARVCKSLKPDGLLYVEVPNIHDALVSTYDIPLHHRFFFHKSHLWYFSMKSLLSLMDLVGFIGEARFIQDYNILNHLAWANTGLPQDFRSGMSPPFVKLKNNEDLNRFFVKIDKEYKHLLTKLGITSNIHFIGKRYQS